jgi:hypothetical protein
MCRVSLSLNTRVSLNNRKKKKHDDVGDMRRLLKANNYSINAFYIFNDMLVYE